MVDTPEHFAPALESLWRAMDEGDYSPYLNATLKRFNGALFRKCRAIALEKDDIRELHIAAGRDWRDVEPAIFGTLLERALDKRERAKLGAHYTPRAYVERLVVPTIIEPLRADWEEALTRAHALEEDDQHQVALQAIKDFHHRLCTTRVLDPACGTGNFLYVSLELMKRLEGEVLDALKDLGENPRLAMKGETVSPHQFHGLELNPAPSPSPISCCGSAISSGSFAPFQPTKSPSRSCMLTAQSRSGTPSWPGTSRSCCATRTVCRSRAGTA